MPKWIMAIIGIAIAATVFIIAYRILSGASGSVKIGEIEVTVVPAQTTSIPRSFENQSGESVKRDYVTTSSASAAIVFDPPSNVRVSPNGKIICSVTSKGSIRIYGEANGWFETDVCGQIGVIHKSQVTFNPNATK